LLQSAHGSSHDVDRRRAESSLPDRSAFPPQVAQPRPALAAPVDLAGYRLPAGVTVAPAVGLVQRSERHYPEALRFAPDRMVGTTLTPTTWLPFGGGSRRCLGATFAQVEMRLVRREALRRVELATTTAPAERQRSDAVA
jgi:cytochrome P450 family 135